MSSIIQITAIDYPESDGRPMGETDLHRKEMIRQIQLLEHYFAGQQVYVSGDLLLYYEQGNPKKYVVPDVFVVRNLQPGNRRWYKLWLERKPPDFVMEVTSRKTKRNDTRTKPELYARLQIPEYFLFDPTQDYLDPPLQGHRLVSGVYERIPADAAGAMVSQQLGLRLRPEGEHLRFYRLDTGERLLSPDEARQEAEEALRREAAARLEAERARLDAEGALLDAERALLDAERALQSEAAVRRAAEAEIVRLRAELERRSGS